MAEKSGSREGELWHAASGLMVDKQISTRLMSKTYAILDGYRGGFANHRVVTCDTNPRVKQNP